MSNRRTGVVVLSVNFIDVVLFLILAACIAGGYFRGFLLSVISFAKYIVGIPFAFWVADSLSGGIYEKFVSQAALKKISSGLSQTADIDSFVSSVREAVGEMPFGIGGSVDLSFLDGVSNDTAATAILNNIVEPVAVAVIKVIVFIIILVLFFVAVWLVSKLIKKLMSSKHAPLKHTNKFLGAVFGALKGVVALAALSAALTFLRDFLFSSSESFVSLVDSSVVIEFINKINPFLQLI